MKHLKCSTMFVVPMLAMCVANSPACAQQPQSHTRDSSAVKRPDPMAGMVMPRQHKPVPAAARKKTSPAKKGAPAKKVTSPAPHDAHAGMDMSKPMPKADTAKTTAAPMGDMKGMPMRAGSDSAKASHDMHDMPATPKAAPAADTHGGMANMNGGQAVDSQSTTRAPMQMMTAPLGVPMDRMASGTTWTPDDVSLPSLHSMAGAWELMLHGFVFAQENVQGGPRGASQFGSLNWGMFMATHEVAGGRFQLRTMLSLDAATVTTRGYPLLLQSGEAFGGVALHDRQHPHDFFMEFGAMYERAVTEDVGVTVYAAPSGEPALGPGAFMHRPSAMDVPVAPIAHHWQDATHISFGVLTAGLFGHAWKLEGSAFNGREPDQYRWNFDPITLDSYSGRLTVNPSEHWSFTGGYGYMKSPESLHPTESMHRITASALHGMKLGTDGQWASTLVWGANQHGGAGGLTHGVLLESEAVLDRTNTIFGRAEWVQKSAEDLVLDTPLSGFATDRIFSVSATSLGVIRELGRWSGATIGLGVMGTLNTVPSALEPAYGSRTPLGALVFVRLRPFHDRAAQMGGMRMTH